MQKEKGKELNQNIFKNYETIYNFCQIHNLSYDIVIMATCGNYSQDEICKLNEKAKYIIPDEELKKWVNNRYGYLYRICDAAKLNKGHVTRALKGNKSYYKTKLKIWKHLSEEEIYEKRVS